MSNKLVVLICREFNTQLSIIAKKRINVNKAQFRYKKNTYIIDIGKPLYKRKNIQYYLYDIDHGQVVTFKMDTAVDPAFLDLIFNKEAIRQLVAVFGKNGLFDASIIGLIIMLLFGVVIGILVGQFIPFSDLTGGGS